MIKQFSTLLATAILCFQVGAAHAAQWQMDRNKSALGYTVEVQGNQIKGSFDEFTASIIFDPEDLAGASIEVTITTTSITTGNSQGDSLVKSGKWLAVDQFDQAKFISDNVERVDGSNFTANGNLTIKETTFPATLEFTVLIEGDNAVANGKATLDRAAMNVGPAASAALPVANEVAIEFEIHATMKN